MYISQKCYIAAQISGAWHIRRMHNHSVYIISSKETEV